MSRWNKLEAKYPAATEHHDLDYIKDQTRDGDLRRAVNAWRFASVVQQDKNLLDFGCSDDALFKALGGGKMVEVNPHARATPQARG